MKIIYLKPKASFRNELRSDSLFGLLLWGIRLIYGSKKAEAVIESFVNGNPPFLLGSAFPYLQKDDKKIRFYPKPIIPPLYVDDSVSLALYKRYKKIKYVPESVFEKFASGKINDEDFFRSKEWERMEQASIASFSVMHNNIDRISNASVALFYTPEYYIRDGGLYFLMEISNPEIAKMLNGLFQFFEHTGFGGDASTGKSSFSFEIDEFNPDWLTWETSHRLSLSLYYPAQKELDVYHQNEKDVWYRLIFRKGKIGGRYHIQSNVWKKGVNVFTEGSIFPAIENHKIFGGFPVVKEPGKANDFPVYYYGYPLMIGFNLKGN